jgi:hypothetical protein
VMRLLQIEAEAKHNSAVLTASVLRGI